jgi:hypothetical protein
MDYRTLENLLNTRDGMTYVVNNVKHDDDSVTVTPQSPLSWFKFSSAHVERLYCSGNGYIAFNANNEKRSLKVNRRDQAMYYLAYEQGTIHHDYDFFRIYWSGFSYHSQTGGNYKLSFDMVLLSNGKIFLSISDYPSSSNDGTNTLNASGGTVTYSPSSSNRTFTFTPSDENGTQWSVENGIVEPVEFPTKYLLGDSTDKIYTVENSQLIEIQDTLSSTLFMTRGLDSIPQLVKDIPNFRIYKWSSDDYEEPFVVTVSAIPTPRTVTCVADMSHESITGITSIGCSYDGTVNIQYSYDGTTYTSKMSVTDFLAISPETLYDGLGIENKIYFKFWLEDDTSALTNLVIRYQNTE